MKEFFALVFLAVIAGIAAELASRVFDAIVEFWRGY